MSGTTLTALNAGSIKYSYVCAIEGYSYLLTSAAPAAAVTAWSGTDWAAALGGLFVELNHKGSADPWAPLQGGGTCTLRVQADPGAATPDAFGIDTHRKLNGAETYLAATADRDDTTITVKSTTGFASAPGVAYIGTEAFVYAGKTATTFTGCDRGFFSPLDRGAGSRFAAHHRQGLQANGATLDPIVSAQPRTWIGKWVGVWLHRDVGGTLDVKAQAQLVYFGRIVEIRDDPTTGCTVVQLKHVMDSIVEGVIGRDMYSAQIPEGVYLTAGTFLGFTDWADFPANTSKSANNLVIVASGATGTNQINAGYYSLSAICNAINSWLGAELAATRIYGTYSLESPVGVPTPSDPPRSNMIYLIPGTSNKQTRWGMSVPNELNQMLGFKPNPSGVTGYVDILSELHPTNGFQNYAGVDVPLTTLAFANGGFLGPNNLQVANEAGTFADQYALLPSTCVPPQQAGLQWGLFLIDDRFLVVASHTTGSLHNLFNAYGLNWPNTTAFEGDVTIARSADDTSKSGPIPVRQILALETSFASLIKYLFYGTGTAGYNDATYDALGYGLGLGLPGALFPGLNASIDGLPGATGRAMIIIDKPTKLVDLIESDLVLRWAFPRWKAGAITFSTWQTPVAQSGLVVLSESSKSAPAGNVNELRVATALTDVWQRDTLTIQYNRDVTQPTSDTYTSQLTLENGTSVDDNGGEGHSGTIKARNVFADANNAGTGIETLAPQFMATWALFSQPMRQQSLPISPKYYEQLAPGDTVLVSDSFARDPSTGRRGIAARPALVVSVDYNRGGAQPTDRNGTDAQGTVVVIFAPDGSRLTAYAYAARVDETATGSGFTAGYNSSTSTLRCKDHDYSETYETKDAGNFVAGDKLLIIEIDPAVSGSPVFWQRTVLSVSGNDVALTAALSSPAFDSSKLYRVTYDHYAVATADQQLLCFQADTDGLIEDLAPPYQFGASTELLLFSPYDPTILPEIAPDASWGDGKAYDVGHESGLIQTVNCLDDYRTARECPQLYTSAVAAPVGTGSYTYELLDFYPVHLSAQIMSTAISRLISVAPFFRSNTGAAVNLRVTLARTPPRADLIDDHPRPAIYDEAIFTTSSTSFQVSSAKTLNERVKDPFTGIAWVWIEGSVHCETRGLARFTQGARP